MYCGGNGDSGGVVVVLRLCGDNDCGGDCGGEVASRLLVLMFWGCGVDRMKVILTSMRVFVTKYLRWSGVGLEWEWYGM